MLKLLIADTNEEFCMALADLLEGTYVVRVCQEGNQTIETIRAFRPDFLVLDLMLPGLDGISLLERAVAEGFSPTVLAVSKMITDYVEDALGELGVSYLMRKPCDLNATVARINELSKRITKPAISRPDQRTVACNMLLALGISPKLDGYGYLRDAVLEIARKPGQRLSKELYPKVGGPAGASATQVERCIRTAIIKAWQCRDEKLWQLYFPSRTDGTAVKPSNAVFINSLAARLIRNSERYGQ